MSKLDDLRAGMASSRATTDAAYAQQLRNNKQPAMEAFQKGEISAQEYEEVVGEPYAVTVKDHYDASIARLKNITAVRVRAGLLTPQQYKEITGDDYSEEGYA
ncbi:XkdX family protein [Vermiculatibacterium agrestimuris]|uniref:XkdX family protein n=1 Tax=Vermiculatibacterium agrestimuris TaxID=2941519 RepID=UPI00203AAADC|nr:XkdX family protein [Vermiculatibacterium agrestimuris]